MSVGLQVWSQTASANSTSDTNINWAEGMAPSQVNDSARALMASMAKWRDDNNASIVTGGSSTAFTITSNQVAAANTDGFTIAAKFHATADAAATLAVDGNTAAKIQMVADTNLSGQEIQTGENWRFHYSSASTAWIAIGGGYVQTNDIATNAVTYAKIQQLGATKLLGNATGGSANVEEISLGTNLSFSGTTLNAGNNTPVITIFTSTGSATWNSTTQNGNFPLYLRIRMVGGGGGGGAQSTNNGSTGTDTSFNNWTAIGGGKGSIAAGSANGGVGGSGGTNGTGTLLTRITGAAGNPGAGNLASGTAAGGAGGSSFFGGAGQGGLAGAGGTAVTNSGSGGGGGSQANGTTGAGAGGAGEFVEFIVTSPSTSYSLTVGGGGAGGSAGGAAGGAGGSGRVEVIAYWQ